MQNKIARTTRQKTDAALIWHFENNKSFCSYLDHLSRTRKELSLFLICRPTRMGWLPYRSFKAMWERALKKAAPYNEPDANNPGHDNYMFKEIRHLSNTIQKLHGITVEARMQQAGHKTAVANERYDHTEGELTALSASVLTQYGPKKF